MLFIFQSSNCNPTNTQQEEAVPESLKNILLVMASSGYLVPASQEPSQQRLWTETWKRLDRFLPDLRKELNLEERKDDERKKNSQAVQSQATVISAARPTGVLES